MDLAGCRPCGHAHMLAAHQCVSVQQRLCHMQAIVLERPVFVREQSDGLYRVITYLTFKVMEEVVLALLSSVAFSLVVYYLVKLQGSFFPVWIVFLVTQLVGVGKIPPWNWLPPPVTLSSSVRPPSIIMQCLPVQHCELLTNQHTCTSSEH